MGQKKFISKRFFLNPDGDGVAAACAHASVDFRIERSGVNKYPAMDVDVSISLSDCNRQIHLEFDVWLGGDRKQALKALREKRKKLARLKEVVDAFVAGATEAYDFVEANLDEYLAHYKRVAEAKKKEP